MNLFILALPRTGSTTLYHLCRCHPDAVPIYEPFRNGTGIKKPNGKFMEFKNSYKSFSKLSDYNIIKSIYNQMSNKYNRLYAKKYKSVYLTRRNFLQQAVSIQIAIATDRWHPDERFEPRNDRERVAAELKILYPNGRSTISLYDIEITNVNKIARNIVNLQRDSKKIHKVVPLSAKHYTYESIFNKSLDEQIGILRAILTHGNFDPDKLDYKKAEEILSNGRYNEEAYQKIKGLEKVNKLLGSEENGFLW